MHLCNQQERENARHKKRPDITDFEITMQTSILRVSNSGIWIPIARTSCIIYKKYAIISEDEQQK